MTGDLATVVQSQQQFVFHQSSVDAADTTLQTLAEFQLDPHTEKYCHGIADEPGDPQPKQYQPHLLTEQNSQEYHECCEDPHNQYSFVENIEHCKSHVSC